jgi:hypothetical protein
LAEGFDPGLVEPVKDRIQALKTILEQPDAQADSIRSSTSELMDASMKLGAAQYQAADKPADQTNPDQPAG